VLILNIKTIKFAVSKRKVVNKRLNPLIIKKLKKQPKNILSVRKIDPELLQLLCVEPG
jgi:hypothetical protein